MKFFCSFLLLFPVVFMGNAQFQWDIYDDSNSPLQDNSVRVIEEDDMQNIWVGTDYGLYWFDGSSWITYDTSNSAIPSNNIRALELDQNNELWIGTTDSGLIHFDGTTFTSYTTFNSGLPDNFVKTITADTSGNIWAGTTFGIAQKSPGNTWTVRNAFNSPLWSNNISGSVFADSSVYLGSFNGGLSVIEDTNVTVYNSYTSTFPDNTVLSVDTFNNKIWCATPSQGITIYNGPGLFSFHTESSSNLTTDNLTFIEGDNDVYIGSYDKGVFKYNGGQFTNFNTSNSPLPEDYIHCIEVVGPDVWIGTNGGGLVKITGFNSIEEQEEKNFNVWFKQDDLHFSEVFTGKLYLYNVLGKLVDTRLVNGDIATSNKPLKAGVYIIRLIENDGRSYSKKIVRY